MLQARKTPQVLRAVLLVWLVLASGCSIERDRSAKAAADWSRGLLLGKTGIKQPVALQVDTRGRVHLVWCEISADGGDALHYARLSERGQVVVDETVLLSVDLPNPRRPQLLIDAEGDIQLAWLSRAGGQQRLYHAKLDDSGQPTSPVLLSGEEGDVDSFRMYASAEGETTFIWSGHSEPEEGQRGVFHRGLHDASSTLLLPEGVDPFVLVDRSGTTHLTWLYEKGVIAARDVYYATLEGARVVPDGGQKLADFRFAESGTYHGPIVGVDMDHVYVIWAVQNLGGGFTPSAARTSYVSFEPGKPSLSNPDVISLPADSGLAYTDYASPYGYGELALLAPGGHGSDFVNTPSTVQSQEGELPVAVSLVVLSSARAFRAPEAEELRFEDSVTLTSSGMQLAVAVLSGGKPVGYQLVSDTPSASVLSTLVADADGNLHLAWIDTAGFREYDVYYATTAPAAGEWLDRTTAGDVFLRATGLVWGVISGVGFLPIVAIWNLAPVMWVVLFYVVSRRERLEDAVAKIGLFGSVVIYTATKLLFLPGLVPGTPFTNRLPEQMASIVALAIPVIILLVALAATYLYTRRSKECTLFQAYLVFALSDGLLTTLLYAPRLFRAA